MHEVMFTEAEIRKIYRKFYHLKSERLFELMIRAKDPNSTKETLSMLKRYQVKFTSAIEFLNSLVDFLYHCQDKILSSIGRCSCN